MTRPRMRRASFVALSFGAISGCDGPGSSPPFDPQRLFAIPEQSDKDSSGGDTWVKYLDAPALHAVWSPTAQSIWRPFHRTTLISAVELVSRGARPIHAQGSMADQQADDHLKSADLMRKAYFVDLPGEESVAWGVKLARRGMEPVLTFCNWPHQRGLVKLERTLGAMLYYAAELDALRKATPPSPAKAGPAFLLEGTRLVNKDRSPSSGEFDNRYFHGAYDFPTAEALFKADIDTVVYVQPRIAAATGCEDDLVDYFAALQKAGVKFQRVVVGGTAPAETAAWVPQERATVFETARTSEYRGNRGGVRVYSPSLIWFHSAGTWGSPMSGGGRMTSGGGGGGRSSSSGSSVRSGSS